MANSWAVVVFWGAAWGITEATVGYIIHNYFLTAGITGLVMFPIAFYFMDRAYRESGEAGAIFLAATVAAMVKLVDLLVPVRLDRVLNPAMSILLEAAVMYIAYRWLERDGQPALPGLATILGVSLGWRGLYLLYVRMLSPALFSISPASDAAALARFLGMETAGNAVIIYLYLLARQRWSGVLQQRRLHPSAALSLTALTVALLVQYLT